MKTLRGKATTYYDSVGQGSDSAESRINGDMLATIVTARNALRDKWTKLIDYTLIEWGLNPADFEDEGTMAPTREAVCKACDVARIMQSREWPLPTGVIPDGEGGIVFENRNDPLYQRLEILSDGSMNLVTFHDCTFQSSIPVEIE